MIPPFSFLYYIVFVEGIQEKLVMIYLLQYVAIIHVCILILLPILRGYVSEPCFAPRYILLAYITKCYIVEGVALYLCVQLILIY